MSAHPDAVEANSAHPVDPVVVAVDLDDQELGVVDKLLAHTSPGILHRAISVMIYDDDRTHVLLQRRAEAKATWAGWWSNSCCTHPLPGEDVLSAATRRVHEELGLSLTAATVTRSFSYVATDPGSDAIEREHDTVIIAKALGPPELDPSEVAEIMWVAIDDLEDSLLTPWAPQVHTIGLEALAGLT